MTHPHRPDLDGHRADRHEPDDLESLRREVAELRAIVASLRNDAVDAAPGSAGSSRAVAAAGSRRQVLRMAGVAVAGGVAGTMAGPGRAAAADPNDVVRNISNPVIDTTTLDGGFPGPVFSLFNRGTAGNASALYASCDALDLPTVRADNAGTAGLGGVALGGNAPGGRDVYALGSGRIAMTDHNFDTGANEYQRGELHQSGGTVYAMVTPGVRRAIVGPTSSGALFPIAPARVYDSRRPAPQPGRMVAGDSRLITVADGRSESDGAVISPNIVPPGATAIAFNVTAVNTAGRGFVAVVPGDVFSSATSLVNWTTETAIANASLVGLDNSRGVRILCGGEGSTDVVIDVLGYYA
jgi:hypothetical protein